MISCDPYVSDAVKEQYPDVEFVDFDTLLERSDIISIHVILTPETTHVFNKDAFRKMKDNAMIINTSRGPVIDQKAHHGAGAHFSGRSSAQDGQRDP